MEKINKPNASFTQQANSDALAKKKIHTSLTAQILILFVSIVVLVAATISAISMITIDRYSKQELEAQARISIQYLNGDLIFAPNELYFDSTDWQPDPDWDPPNRLWHQAAMANHDTIMIVDPYIDAYTHELVITISRTVKDDNGTITGVIAVDVLLNKLAEIVLAQKITPEEYLQQNKSDKRLAQYPDSVFHVFKRSRKTYDTRGKWARLTISKSPMIKTTYYTGWGKIINKRSKPATV
jgi:hypothetical protein